MGEQNGCKPAEEVLCTGGSVWIGIVLATSSTDPADQGAHRQAIWRAGGRCESTAAAYRYVGKGEIDERCSGGS